MTGNQKTIWNNLNLILTNSNKNKNINIEYLMLKGKKIDDPGEICEEINDHFTHVGENLANKIKLVHKIQSEETIYPKSMFLNADDITTKQIEEIIDELDSRKATGYDNISVKIVKILKSNLTPVLLHLTKISFKTGQFPKKMKIAKILPIFKNGDHFNCNNYRPISILPVFSKILEKIMNIKLSDFLESKKLLFTGQYGFRRSKDTEVAVIDVITDIQRNVDNDSKCCLLSLDLCKAFDTVNHSILLKYLYNIGIRGILYSWFQNYLSDRNQFVQIANIKSGLKKISCGVPQGSILGPVLFLIYINSISNLNLKGSIKLFADDTTILYFGKKTSEIYYNIQHDLKVIFRWLQCNKLTLNFNKSTFMFISKNQINNNVDPILFMNNQIKYTQTIKFLGLYIDENLNWKKHVDYLRNYISPIVGILYKARYYIPLKYLKNIYFSLIYSKLQYLISIWGSANLTTLKPLKKLQNKVIKCIHKLPFLEPTENLYKTKGFLDITNLYKLKTCVLLHFINLKEKHSNITLTQINVLHNHATRQNDNIKTPTIKSNFGKRSILYDGIIIYNNLPRNLKSIKNVLTFKKQIKKYFLER